MAVISKKYRDKLELELSGRFNALLEKVQGRNLKSATEGAKKGHWSHPDELCYINSIDLNLALGDCNYRRRRD